MRSETVPALPKWPFFLGDALLLGLAAFICFQSPAPITIAQLLLGVGCVAFGAALAVLPFLLEYRALVRVAEAQALTSVVAQVQNLETLARQISSATGQWQDVQQSADKTAALAKGMVDRMSAEAQAFAKFIENANNSEKAVLRLEVEKLRRAEGDWLQVIVRMLDHIFALHNAAMRSGRRDVTEQLKQFQTACHDAARRIGLVAFTAAPEEAFDERKHQLLDSDARPATGAVVAEIIASGYTFQGRLLRRALVRLRNGENESALKTTPVADASTAQSQLRLEAGS